MLREPDVQVGFQTAHDTLAEASAIANLLAEHTGWNVDRNLLLIHSRIFGWKSEHEYVNARCKPKTQFEDVFFSRVP